MHNRSPRSVLIVKTSSLGDVIQSFPVLHYLHRRFPGIAIDWAISKSLESLVTSHPYVRKTIPIDFRSILSSVDSLSKMRKTSYDVLFDLQGNCKSGLVTLLARAKEKVGFGIGSAREWPNVLATGHRFAIPRHQNIRLFHLQLVQRFFKDQEAFAIEQDHLCIDDTGKAKISSFLAMSSSETIKIMICPGSRWVNKQLPLETWTEFLLQISHHLNASFFCMWGSESEKKDCEQLCKALDGKCILVDKLPWAIWQNLMSAMDLVLAVDSSALHLCGTTMTPSFSIFGPTSFKVFKPLGPQHSAIQGPCPYGERFDKQCPLLRTCPTGACIRNLDAKVLFQAFQTWWKSIKASKIDA